MNKKEKIEKARKLIEELKDLLYLITEEDNSMFFRRIYRALINVSIMLHIEYKEIKPKEKKSKPTNGK